MRKFHKNFTDKDLDPVSKRSAGRIRILIQMTLQVGSGSGSEINSFGSATLTVNVLDPPVFVIFGLWGLEPKSRFFYPDPPLIVLVTK